MERMGCTSLKYYSILKQFPNGYGASVMLYISQILQYLKTYT